MVQDVDGEGHVWKLQVSCAPQDVALKEVYW